MELIGLYSCGSRVSERGLRQPKGGGLPTNYLAKNNGQKLHENERNWTERGGDVHSAHLGSANVYPLIFYSSGGRST